MQESVFQQRIQWYLHIAESLQENEIRACSRTWTQMDPPLQVRKCNPLEFKQKEKENMIDSIIICPSKSQCQSERNGKVRSYLGFISEARYLLNMECCQSLSVGWKPSRRVGKKMPGRSRERRGITKATALLKTVKIRRCIGVLN